MLDTDDEFKDIHLDNNKRKTILAEEHGTEIKNADLFDNALNENKNKGLETVENSHHSIINTLEKIALKEISIQDINKTEHTYLLKYFSDGNGNIDVKN
ncbi:hypothetical protein J4731_14205 [Providencia rettgeri]|nr:hypothetical protein [Providencia rettgeri]